MENITELWAGKRERGEGALRSTSPNGCDPLFIRERTMHLARGASTEWEGSVKFSLHRYSRAQERLNIFLFCNPATRYLVTFSPRDECRWRGSRWLTSESLLLGHDSRVARDWVLHKNATISFKCELFKTGILRRRNRIAQRVQLMSE